MFKPTPRTKNYNNFVKASSPDQKHPQSCLKITNQGKPVISGDEARRIYLEEVKDVSKRSRSSTTVSTTKHMLNKTRMVYKEVIEVSNSDLFLTVQNNDVSKMRLILDKFPDKINIVDDYGWSLLMIACQANSIDCVKELLKRQIDMSVRDKAGNSARSLVIKNKNYTLAEILLNHRENESKPIVVQDRTEQKVANEYTCDICQNTFFDKGKHLSSTLHNINASKGMKIPTNYVIPTSNRGYQIMVKGGWDRDSGLGRNGTGKKYPIKTVQKKDKKGLGHKNIANKKTVIEDNVTHKSKHLIANHYNKNRRFEINFRREFY